MIMVLQKQKNYIKKVNVTFPIKGLDMSHFSTKHNGESVYDLYAVANHHKRVIGGHYTAYCKNVDNQKWYLFDDNKVKQVEESILKQL